LTAPDKRKARAAADAWQEQLLCTKHGEPRETFNNLCLALEHLEPYAQQCWYDAVRDVCMVGREEITESTVHHAARLIEVSLRLPVRTPRLVDMALSALCHQRPRDILQEWLIALPAWDETPRLSTWLSKYANAADTPYSADVSRILLASLVARAMHPGCQSRYVVVLEGPENAGKSKLIEAIANGEIDAPKHANWYREISHGLEGKEAHMRLRRAWVVELAELSSLRSTSEARLKAFLTLKEDAYIPKYANHEISHKRRAVFIATHNPEGDNRWLPGQTGNTRWLPIEVSAIDIQSFLQVRTQLFAEALAYYTAHQADWWQLSDQEAASEAREDRRQPSTYEGEQLAAWLKAVRECAGPVTAPFHWEDVARDCFGISADRWTKGMQMEIGKALRVHGWCPKTTRKDERRAKLWHYGAPETDEGEAF
jgi:predicted P-loop ATPase